SVTLGLTSHEHDDELGLINMRGRVFDPSIRRFATPDPLLDAMLEGGGVDRYGYVRGDPTNLVDPLGLESGFYDSCGPGGCTHHTGDIANFGCAEAPEIPGCGG